MTSRDGTAIAFDRRGSGPPVVLIGGALADRSAAAPLAEQLAPSLTTFAYDRRGRGASGDTAPYAVERELEDVGALIERAGAPAFVFGHSSGAVLALDAALAFPGRVARLAAYEPPFVVDATRSPLPDGYVGRLEALVAEGRRGEAVEFFLTRGPGLPDEAVDAMRDTPFWSSMEAMAHTLAYDGRVMHDHMGGTPRSLERWATMTVPTLVMDGGASPPWQRNAVRTLLGILPDARHRTLEGQDHGPAAEVLAPALLGFFGA